MNKLFLFICYLYSVYSISWQLQLPELQIPVNQFSPTLVLTTPFSIILVHSVMLFSLLFCVPVFLPPLTVSCSTDFVRPYPLATCPNHLNFSPVNHGGEFFIRPNGLPYSALDFLINYVDFVGVAQQFSEASHF
jgi:hypothetical protein